MRRFHLLEIHEHPWCPGFIRDGLTSYLQAQIGSFGIYDVVLPEILALAVPRGGQVLDLCSGGGGPWVAWEQAGKLAELKSVTLSDLHPSGRVELRAVLSYERRPVSAMNVPPGLAPVRTLFTSLHHFEPHQVRAMLADAVAQGSAFGAFEYTHRSLPALGWMLLGAFSCWGRGVARILRDPWPLTLFTVIVPVVPLILVFDGLVSCLRTYTPAELLALAPPGYQWKSQCVKGERWPLPVTILTGSP